MSTSSLSTGLPFSENIEDEEGTQTDHASLLKNTPGNARGTIPWFAWTLLGASLLAVSSAAVVFASIPDVPTFTLAAWRLQLTALLLTPAAIHQYRQLTTDDKRRLFKDSLLVLASGAFLALHFSCWVWSIHHTSLTHALLYGSTAPVLIAMGTLMMRKPISTGEIVGTFLGLVGVILLTRANKMDQQVTLAGDFAGLLTAVFFCGYIIIGAHLRRWLPIFLYATPVTGFAALLLSVAAVTVDKARWLSSDVQVGGQHHGLFGWLIDTSYLPKILYLAVVPGIVGHTGFNAALKWMPALLVTLALTAEPLIGTFLGWAVHLVQVPGMWTYSGGAVLLLSTAIVVIAGDTREQAAAAAADVQQRASESPKTFSDYATDGLQLASDSELAEPR